MTSFDPLFTWVHLSDIHMGHGSASHKNNQQIVLARLKDDIEDLISSGLPELHAIIVTGDIAFSGGVQDVEEYERAAHWLKEIAQCVSVSTNRVFVIPGNHDVQRNVDEENRNVARLLGNLRSGNEDIDDALEDDGDLALLRARLRSYLHFANQFTPANMNKGSDSADLFWSHKLEIREGLAIRLIGFNTALLCAKETDELGDERRIRLGQQQIAAAFVSTPIERNSEIVLALTHHPVEWLSDKDDVVAAIRRYAHIHLSGHVHEAQSEHLRSGTGTDLVRVVSGATHGEPANVNAPATHGYNIGSLGVREDGQIVLRIWPRIWSRHYNFRVDHDSIPDVDNDNNPYHEHYVDHEIRFKLPDHRPIASETLTKPAASVPNLVHSASVEETHLADPEAWNDRGVTLSEQGRYQEALEACEEALKLWPNFPEAWNNKGAILSELGRCQEALEAYEMALSIKPEYPEAWHGRGWALSCLQRHEEALEAYDRALDLTPDYLDAQYNKGLALLKLSRLQEALGALDEVLSRNPGDSQAWSNRGLTLDYLGRYQEALEAYNRALQGRPFSPQTCLGKGMTLAKLNRRDEAVVWLCRAWSRREQLTDKGSQVAEELLKLGHNPEECRESSSTSAGSTSHPTDGDVLVEEESLQPPAPDTEAGTDTREDDLEKILEVSGTNPESALGRLASLLEREVRVLLGSSGHMEAGLKMTLPQAVQFLVEQGLLPQNTISSLRIYWDLRNEVIHGNRRSGDEEIASVLDMGVALLKAVRAVPHEVNVVCHPDVEVYSDAECTELIPNAFGLILETTSPGGSSTDKRIFPTTRKGYYQKGKRVTWEWNLDRVWGAAWYKDPNTDENKQAWMSAGEFVGRHTEEI